MKKLSKIPVPIIALLQAILLISYIAAVASFMYGAESWVGQLPGFLGITLFLTIFTTSALITATITLGYPAYLFWKSRKLSQSLRLIIYTIVWLVVFILIFLILQAQGV